MESRLGINLPADYRQFLLESNGGTPEYAVYPYGDDSSFVVRSFWQISRVNFLLGVEDYTADVIMIGDSPFGDFLCLGVGETNAGEVGWFDHGSDPDEDPHLGLSILTPTFTEFVKGLKNE